MNSDTSKSEAMPTTPSPTIECLEDLERHTNAKWQALRESGHAVTKERAEEIQSERVERAASRGRGMR